MTLKISSRAISYIDFICINFVWIVTISFGSSDDSSGFLRLKTTMTRGTPAAQLGFRYLIFSNVSNRLCSSNPSLALIVYLFFYFLQVQSKLSLRKFSHKIKHQFFLLEKACIWLYFMYGNKLCDDKVPDLIHHTYTIWSSNNLFCGQSHPGRTDRVYLKVLTALAAAVITFGCDMSALADLNKFEADLLVNSVLDWLLSSVLLLSGW
uniref:Uncharacterized protein n=1 Tax=Helianthus annuus TaxID=4232 RepID=A0A251VF64_HELAN